MTWRSYGFGLALLALCFSFTLAKPLSGNDTAFKNKTNRDHKSDVHSFHVAKFDFARIEKPFTIAFWVLIASLGKLVFHLTKISSVVPESCLVILLGVVVGGFAYAIDMQDVPIFDANVFFLFLLPPIVLEAGYFLQNRAFFENLGTILLYAVVGTLFNAFTVGLSLFGVSGRIGLDLPLMDALLFGTLIAAVDPVAVLAVFEEIHVNVMLYILVFGESLLNDAVTVVLYNMFKNFSLLPEVTAKEVALGLVSFFLVSVGGTLIGVLWGFFTAFVTKYTDHVRVIEPIFVFVMSYAAYLTAELFHFSGIMSIVSCAIIMKPYVEANISRKSSTTVKYFMKMLSSCSETVIFMLLGASVVTRNIHSWNTDFILITIIFISAYRTLGVVILTFFANRLGRLNKLSFVDQFIMSYGGIRGAVSFSLALVLNKNTFKQYNLIFTTTITVVLFTVFVQGITIKPLVKILHVRLRKKEKPLMVTQLSDKLLDHIVAGIEEISGHRGEGYWRHSASAYDGIWRSNEGIITPGSPSEVLLISFNIALSVLLISTLSGLFFKVYEMLSFAFDFGSSELLEYFHSHYLTKWLMRDSHSYQDEILLAYRKMAYRDALTQLEREGSGAVLFAPSASGHHIDLLATNALQAAAVAVREEGGTESEDELGDSEGEPTENDKHVRYRDDALVDWRKIEEPPEDSAVNIEFKDHHNLDSLISAAPKHYHHRTFYRNNLLEDDDLMAARLFPGRHVTRRRRPHRKHRHHRIRCDRKDASAPVKQLSTIFEPDEEVEVERDQNAPQSADTHDPEDTGITFRASPLASEELHEEPKKSKERNVGDRHRHKHHGRHHRGHRDKDHEKSEIPERLDRRLGRLPSFDEDDVIPDTRARDSRRYHTEEDNMRPLPDVKEDISHGQKIEEARGTNDVPSITDEKVQKKTATESQEMSAKDDAAVGTSTADHSGDTDEEDHSVTSALLDENKQKS